MPEIYIDENLCKKCDLCAEFCPKQVFGKKAEIVNTEKCNECGNCQFLCPERAIMFEDANDADAEEEKINFSKPRGGFEKKQIRWRPEYALMDGNEACGQAALDAGCSFFAGYPITPATEIMYKMMELKKRGGIFVQMEDEIASIHAVIGASIAGKKAMTATSGPGLDLMQEGLGLAVSLEIPCVIAVVQRAGPSTGQATRPAQADLMAVVHGSHGDAPRVVLAPSNIQECYNVTLESFKIAEIYRTPVILLLDELLAHTKEKILLPDEIRIFNRIYKPGENILGPPAQKGNEAASMPRPEDGENFTYTGSTHYFNGERDTENPETQQKLNDYLSEKMAKISKLPADIEAVNLSPGKEMVFISFGSPSRSIKKEVKEKIYKNSREVKAGLLILKRLWPFPEDELKKIKQFINSAKIAVVEMNQGQLIQLVKPIFPYAYSLTQNNGLTIEPKRIKKYLETGEW